MLEKLFTSKTRVKLLEFFLVRRGQARVRELSRLIEMPVSAVSRELKNLVDLRILVSDDGRFRMNELSGLSKELESLFVKTDAVSLPIRESLKRASADFILIFGSFARGNFDSESDIDLLFIGDSTSEEIYKFLKPVEKLVGREINPIVWKKNYFLKQINNALVRDIFAKGFIMIKGDENEFRKIAQRKED